MYWTPTPVIGWLDAARTRTRAATRPNTHATHAVHTNNHDHNHIHIKRTVLGGKNDKEAISLWASGGVRIVRILDTMHT